MKLDVNDMEFFQLLIKVCPEFVHPGVLQDFFRNRLSEYTGELNKKNLSVWLKEKISSSFISLRKPPKWIQSGAWPLENGQPMIFLGQINISVANGAKAAQYFHDDTSIYVFMSQEDGEFEVVFQQY